MTPDLQAPTTQAPGITRPVSLTLTGVWFLGAMVLGIIAIYFLGVDQGSVSISGPGMLLHELFHDARHSLGFPCH